SKPQVEGSVPLDPDVLITTWGMTKEEAAHAAGSNRRSFLALPIKRQLVCEGLLFADSTELNQFGNDEGFEARKTAVIAAFGEALQTVNMPDALHDVTSRLFAVAPRLGLGE